METKELTSDELYEMYKAKLREENGGTSTAVYSMFLEWGRMGTLTGTFLASEEDIMEASGKQVYFGEVLGKHSEIYVDDFDEIIIDLVTDDPAAVKIFREYGLTSGYNPFDYISEDE